MTASQKPIDEILEFINSNFDYEPDTGDLYRLGLRTSEWHYVRPKLLYSGSRVNNPQVRIDKHCVLYTANICYFLKTGSWPKEEVDHKDRDPTNNKWGNLRLANKSMQGMNQTRFLTRKYLPGVSFSTKNQLNPYISKIGHKGCRIYLGCYATEMLAHEAFRTKYQELYGEPLHFPYKEWHAPVVKELSPSEAKLILADFG